MNPRMKEPRRTDDAVLRTLASESLNAWLGAVSKKVVVWVSLTLVGTVAGASWAASAWATNTRRDVESNTARILRIELEQQRDREAMREVTQQLALTTQALDSLRITLQSRPR